MLEGEMTDFDPEMWLCSQGEGEAAGLGGSSSPAYPAPLTQPRT